MNARLKVLGLAVSLSALVPSLAGAEACGGGNSPAPAPHHGKSVSRPKDSRAPMDPRTHQFLGLEVLRTVPVFRFGMDDRTTYPSACDPQMQPSAAPVDGFRPTGPYFENADDQKAAEQAPPVQQDSGKENPSEPSEDKKADQILVTTTRTMADGAVATIEGGYNDGLEYMKMTISKGTRTVVGEGWFDPSNQHTPAKFRIYENGRLVEAYQINADGSVQGEKFNEDGQRTGCWWEPASTFLK